LVVVGPAGRPDHDQQHCYHQAPTVNQMLLLQLLQLLMMGMRIPETCWAVFKWQVINLRICCIWLVDSVESMMMHGLGHPKKNKRCKAPRTVIYIFLSFPPLGQNVPLILHSRTSLVCSVILFMRDSCCVLVVMRGKKSVSFAFLLLTIWWTVMCF